MLHGLIKLKAAELVPLAKSSLSPPVLTAAGEGGACLYDQLERAYVVEPVAGAAMLTLRLEGSAESPVLNPAFILRGWAPRSVRVTVDGVEVKEGDALRIGRRRSSAETSDLIVWLELDRQHPAVIEIVAA